MQKVHFFINKYTVVNVFIEKNDFFNEKVDLFNGNVDFFNEQVYFSSKK